jgi:hypothetical protein
MIFFLALPFTLRDLTLFLLRLEIWHVTHSTYPFYDCFLVYLLVTGTHMIDI